jgi:hypothetical protein
VTVERAKHPYASVEPTDYEYLRDEIINLLNPADDDMAEPWIMVCALQFAVEFIQRQLCICTPERVEDHDACPRCRALGRLDNKRVER